MAARLRHHNALDTKDAGLTVARGALLASAGNQVSRWFILTFLLEIKLWKLSSAAKQIPQINDSLTWNYVNINITLLRAFAALPPGRAQRLGCNVIPKLWETDLIIRSLCFY